MQKDIEKYKRTEGYLLKNSTNIFVGLQPKLWKVINDGTALAYRNVSDKVFLHENTFLIKDIFVTEVDVVQDFLLITPNRQFQLKAESQFQKNQWIRALTQLKKHQEKQQKKAMKKAYPNNTYAISTLPSLATHQNTTMNQTMPNIRQNEQSVSRLSPQPSLSPQQGGGIIVGGLLVPPAPPASPASPAFISSSHTSLLQSPSAALTPSFLAETRMQSTSSPKTKNEEILGAFESSMNSFMQPNPQSPSRGVEDVLPKEIREQLSKLSAEQLKYFVCARKLKTSKENLFGSKKLEHSYVMFSSKSLHPQEHTSEYNLYSGLLPHWAEIDRFYRVGAHIKEIFSLRSIVEIQQHRDYCALIVSTAEDAFQFYMDTLQDRKNFKKILETAIINAKETFINGVHTRRNYDYLVHLHSENLQDFQQKVQYMLMPYLPTNHAYEPNVPQLLINSVMPLMGQVIGVLTQKVTPCRAVIVSFLGLIHEEIKMHIKLTWDTSFGAFKNGEMLRLLQSISNYETLMREYINDKQLLEAMKELSKMYVRESYRNFESIIIGIIRQQKSLNTYDYVKGEVLETHGVVDFFKFLHQVFDIAAKCWESKLHLHNINKMVQRALQLYISELRSAVDEEDIPQQQLIALANNYFRVKEEVHGLYQERFGELLQRTKDIYEKIVDEYRQVAMIILDKISLGVSISLKIYFNGLKNFMSIDMESVYPLVINSQVYKDIDKLHELLMRRLYTRIFTTIREQIVKLLEKELLKNKKKIDFTRKYLEALETYREDFAEMAKHLSGNTLRIGKDIEEIIIVMTSKEYHQIRAIVMESPEPYNKVYTKIVTLRNDYFEGSPLHKQIQISENPIKSSVQEMAEGKEPSLHSVSRHYMQQFDRSSISSHTVKEVDEKELRLITAGYVVRMKPDQSLDKIYLKLKNGVLYLYESEQSERCLNTLKLDCIKAISPEKARFTITYSPLRDIKALILQCESQEERERWVLSLELELKRVANDSKVKEKVRIKQGKSKMIKDYYELERGEDFFSYTE